MPLASILGNYGYKRITKTRLLSPHSKSKLAGCILLTGGDVDKVYIHHASDPLRRWLRTYGFWCVFVLSAQ